MKWLFVLLLALIIFGGAAWFGYNTFVKEEIAVKKERAAWRSHSRARTGHQSARISSGGATATGGKTD
jgi:hypothetical protein